MLLEGLFVSDFGQLVGVVSESLVRVSASLFQIVTLDWAAILVLALEAG